MFLFRLVFNILISIKGLKPVWNKQTKQYFAQHQSTSLVFFFFFKCVTSQEVATVWLE